MSRIPFVEAEVFRCECKPASKKLVVCIDGTSNQFGLKNTNVVELYSNLHKDANQLTYYDSGIGTSARSSWTSPGTALKHWIDTELDLVLALNIEKIILRAYTWLSNHFSESDTKADQIYLFGFSRGAYQVRILAAMIETVGLLLPGNDAQVPFAYEIYANLGARKSDEEKEVFKATFSRKHARVHFLGVWDTVAAVSVHSKHPPLVVGDCNHICFVRHALALDERRAPFMYLPISERPSQSPPSPSLDRIPHIKEVWFAGTHSEVGGGSRENIELDSGNVALTWMREEAQLAGLVTSTPDLRMRMLDREGLPDNRLTGIWKLAQIFYRCRVRQVRPDQKIHVSVLFKRQEYKPVALIPPDCSYQNHRDHVLRWDDKQSAAKIEQLDWHWEKGIFDPVNAKIIMERVFDGTNREFVHYIAFMARSTNGSEAIKAVENVQELLNSLLAARPGSINPDISIGALVTLVELDMVSDHCRHYLQECSGVLVSAGAETEFGYRFLESVPRLVKDSSLREIIEEDFVPLILGQFENVAVSGGTRSRFTDGCVRALAAVFNAGNKTSTLDKEGGANAMIDVQARKILLWLYPPPESYSSSARSAAVELIRYFDYVNSEIKEDMRI